MRTPYRNHWDKNSPGHIIEVRPFFWVQTAKTLLGPTIVSRTHHVRDFRQPCLYIGPGFGEIVKPCADCLRVKARSVQQLQEPTSGALANHRNHFDCLFSFLCTPAEYLWRQYLILCRLFAPSAHLSLLQGTALAHRLAGFAPASLTALHRILPSTFLL